MLPVLILSGPTASGKSDLALALARRVGGEVVNADSMQVYGALRVLTARPEAPGDVAHHLYGHVGGHVEAGTRYSAGRYAEEAAGVIAALRARGRVPVVVGGTGLYLRALTEGLSAGPVVAPAAEARATALFAADPAAARAALVARDPKAAALRPSDTARHVRRMAVLAATGRTLTAWQAAPGAPPVPGPVRGAVLCPPRDALYARIDARAARDFAASAEEVVALMEGGLPGGALGGPLGRALGVRPIAAMLRGEVEAAEALAAMQRDTRRYAKRQLTWLRGQTAWPWFEDAERALAYLAAGVTDSSA